MKIVIYTAVKLLFISYACLRNVTGNIFLRGITATNRLLRGSIPLVSPYAPKAKTFRFVKPGTYDNAQADFLSVKPTNVRNYEGPDGVSYIDTGCNVG